MPTNETVSADFEAICREMDSNDFKGRYYDFHKDPREHDDKRHTGRPRSGLKIQDKVIRQVRRAAGRLAHRLGPRTGAFFEAAIGRLTDEQIEEAFQAGATRLCEDAGPRPEAQSTTKRKPIKWYPERDPIDVPLNYAVSGAILTLARSENRKREVALIESEDASQEDDNHRPTLLDKHAQQEAASAERERDLPEPNWEQAYGKLSAFRAYLDKRLSSQIPKRKSGASEHNERLLPLLKTFLEFALRFNLLKRWNFNREKCVELFAADGMTIQESDVTRLRELLKDEFKRYLSQSDTPH